MNITEKIDMLLNEAQWKVGQWVVQHRTDENDYGLLIDQLKNGSWSWIHKSDERVGGKAVKGSTKGAFPALELIDVSKVPPKIKEKVLQKAKQLGIQV